MEQIELVIRLQKKLYDEILSPRRMDEEDASACYDAIKNGTPLPKGHGRLIDVDASTFPPPHKKELTYYMVGWNACLRSVLHQPTIIEADKEGAEMAREEGCVKVREGAFPGIQTCTDDLRRELYLLEEEQAGRVVIEDAEEMDKDEKTNSIKMVRSASESLGKALDAIRPIIMGTNLYFRHKGYESTLRYALDDIEGILEELEERGKEE